MCVRACVRARTHARPLGPAPASLRVRLDSGFWILESGVWTAGHMRTRMRAVARQGAVCNT